MGAYLVGTLVSGGIYAVLALSLNLAWGGAGMVNLGLAGFFAVGAYASAIVTGAGAPFPVGLLAALAAGVVAGVVVTFATLRLRDDYLAIVTLGFGEVIRLVALNERWLTNGADGISGIEAPLKPWLGVQGFNLFYLGLVVAIVLVLLWLLRRLDRSPYGRALRAVREDPELARFAGKNVLRFKFEAFALSAAIAGLGGALYAHFQSYISPDLFAPLITIYIFLAVTMGGVGRPMGAVLGGFAVMAFLEAARFAVGGVFTPQWSSVSDPKHLWAGLRDWLLARGVRIVTGEVRAVASGRAMLAAGGTLAADAVIVAAGAWSGRLARAVGDPVLIESERGYNTTIPKPAVTLGREIIFAERSFVATPLGCGSAERRSSAAWRPRRTTDGRRRWQRWRAGIFRACAPRAA